MKKNILFIFLIELFLCCCISSLVERVSLIQGVLFWTFLLGAILLPGMGLTCLAKLRYSDSYKFLFVSFALGYSAMVIIYLVLLVLGLQQYVSCPIILLSICSVYLLYKNISIIPWNESKYLSWWWIPLLFGGMYLVCLIVFQGNTLSPDVNGSLTACQDYIFWLKNSSAVMYGYPVPDFNIYGQQLQYHFFSNLPLATAHLMTGIELFEVCFTFGYIIAMLLAIGAFYILTTEFVPSKLISYALILILFCTTLERITLTDFVTHLYYQIGFTEALSVSIVSFCLFKEAINEKGVFTKNSLFSILLMFVAFGLKATVACVTFAGIGILCLQLLFNKQTWLKALTMGAALFLTFCVSLIVLMAGRPLEMSKNSFTFDTTYTLFKSGYFKQLYESLYSIIPVSILAYLFTAICFIIFAYFLVIILTICVYKYSRNTMNKYQVGLAFIVTMGFVMAFFLKHFGYANIWFFLASVPYTVVFPLSFVSSKDVTDDMGRIKKYLITAIFIGLVGFSITEINHATVGMARIAKHGNSSKAQLLGTTITSLEMEGLRWLRDHSPQNAVLLSNKVIAEDGMNSSVTSAFSERQVYYEFYHYADDSSEESIKTKLEEIRNCYDGNSEALLRFYKKGVNYLVVFKAHDFNPLLYSQNLKHIVYENDDMFILKLWSLANI